MTSARGENNFSKEIEFIVEDMNGEELRFAPEEMNLYLHKIPIILFVEQFFDGVDLKEARYAICHEASKKFVRDIKFFYFQVSQERSTEKLFGRKFTCDFT